MVSAMESYRGKVSPEIDELLDNLFSDSFCEILFEGD